MIQEKIRYCENLEERVYALLKTDEEKAGEELLYLALQAARIILLKNKIVPKTKHDIASQVSFFDRKLGKIIKKLLGGRKLKKEEILGYVEICREVIQ